MPQNWGSWTPYTPTIEATVTGTTNPTLGSGSTQVGYYQQSGVWVACYGTITFGASGVNAGSGWYGLVLPVEARKSVSQIAGIGYLVDSSDSSATRVCSLTILAGDLVADSTHAYFVIDSGQWAAGSPTNPASSAAPWTWAASDELRWRIEYEAATS